jgi:hypothetical protein
MWTGQQFTIPCNSVSVIFYLSSILRYGNTAIIPRFRHAEVFDIGDFEFCEPLFVKQGVNEFRRCCSFASPRCKDIDRLPFANPALNTFNHRHDRIPDMMDSDSAMIFGQGAV